MTIAVLTRCILNCSVKVLLLFKPLKDFEGDPLSPRRGRQPKGNIPLTPFCTSFPCQKWVSRRRPEGNRIFYDCYSRSKDKGFRNPIKPHNNVPLISTKPGKPHRPAVPQRGPEAGDPRYFYDFFYNKTSLILKSRKQYVKILIDDFPLTRPSNPMF